jgi:hypothetical protein
MATGQLKNQLIQSSIFYWNIFFSHSSPFIH